MTEAVAAPGGDPLDGAGTREGEGPGDEPGAPTPAPPAGDDDDEGNRAAETTGGPGAARHPHPTSRRARASARRSRPAGPGGPGPRGPRHMREGSAWSRLLRGAPPVTTDGLERRRNRTMIAMAVAAAAGVGLSLWGTSIVRNSTAGEYVEPAIGPDEPGYQAYVVATPTLAVLQQGDSGELAAAALLSLRPGDEGGAVTLVPVATLVPERTETDGEAGEAPDTGDPRDGGDGAGDSDAGDTTPTSGPGSPRATQPDVSGSTVAEAYEDGGVDAALAALGDVLGVAVDDAVELDVDAWSALVEPAGAVTLTLGEPVGVWPSGQVALPPEQVGAFLAYDGDDEEDEARAARQAAFWSAWLEQVAAGGDEAAPAEADGELARFVAGIARAPSADVLPTVPSEAGGGTLEAEPGPASELIARSVPYPLSPAPGARVRVRLLNGTRDAGLTAEVVPDLVAAGAEITIAGNAASFDVTETTYTYDDPDDQADAERFAEVLGVGDIVEGEQVSVTTQPSGTATTPVADTPEDEIDMTIILGSDVRDLIRRLESTG